MTWVCGWSEWRGSNCFSSFLLEKLKAKNTTLFSLCPLPSEAKWKSVNNLGCVCTRPRRALHLFPKVPVEIYNQDYLRNFIWAWRSSSSVSTDLRQHLFFPFSQSFSPFLFPLSPCLFLLFLLLLLPLSSLWLKNNKQTNKKPKTRRALALLEFTCLLHGA